MRLLSYSLPIRTLAGFVVLFLFIIPTPARAAEDWPPINPDELKMTGDPKAPGAPAIYLYRQVDRDDVENRENYYTRIKIFTEEGRKFADLEIPFVRDEGDIRNIKARTIHPDGSVTNFDGMIYERLIVKSRGFNYWAKTFTMPAAQPGSIVEYRYTRILMPGWVYNSKWLLSADLFTKHAKFSLRQSDNFPLRWSWPRGLPPGTTPPVMERRVVHLEVQDVPALQVEDYMPPQDEMKYRVEFMYTRSLEKDPDKFWQEKAKALYLDVDSFTNKRKSMEQALSQILSPADTPEQKLQKIYARCQQIRNTTFEHEKTQQEVNREKLKEIKNVEDVWRRGYGNGSDITWLFLALARAAGFNASAVMIATRSQHFLFDPKIMDADSLNTNVVLVRFNGKDLYVDPGVAFAPFGILPWSENGVPGLLLEKNGGTWITTSLSDPDASGIERKATLQLDDSGALEGTVTFTYKGLLALSRRLDEDEEDGAGRKKFLEDEIKSYVPTPVEAELTNTPDWSASSPTLVAQYHLKIPGWASAAGRRTFVPIAPFGGGEKHVFESANRVQPIYFAYAYADVDDITIALPQGWEVSHLPEPQTSDLKAVVYGISADKRAGSLHISRRLAVNDELFELKYYGALRVFFQKVRNGDEQQAVLTASTPQ